MSGRSSYDSDFTYSTQSHVKDNDMRSQLFQLMKEKGMVDKLKTQIRQKLISEIAAKESVFNMNNSTKEKELKDIFYHASISIIFEYLTKNDLQYTKSVFAPEVGVIPEQFYTFEELLRILQLDSNSEFFKTMKAAINESSENFLSCLLKTASKFHGHQIVNSDVEAVKSPGQIPLSEKMEKLDMQFEDRQKQGILKTQQLYEDRVIAFQKEIEKRLRQEMENEIQRFKNQEISNLKRNEEERFNSSMKTKSKMLEEEYGNRLTALKERERLSQENVQKYKESLERENYLQRQQLLRDISNMQDRELQNKKEKERLEREFEMMREQYKIKMDQYDERNSRLKESEMGIELRISQEVNGIKLSEEKRLANKWKEVEILEVKLQEEKRYLDSEKQNIEKLKAELLKRQCLFNEMEINEYPVLKQQNTSLHDQIEDLKQQLNQQNVINQQDKHKINCLLKQKMGPSFENSVLTNELERARDIFKRERTILEDQKEVLEKRLLEEVKNKKIITEQFAQQQDFIEVLTRQLSDVKDSSYKSKLGYLSGRSQNNPLNSYRNNYTNRDLSPHSTNDFRKRNYSVDPVLNEPHEIDECSLPLDVEDMANEARQKILDLDEETEQINKAYQAFRNRLANSASAIGEIPSVYNSALVSKSFKDGLEEGRRLKTIETKESDLNAFFESASNENIFINNEYQEVDREDGSSFLELKLMQNIVARNNEEKITEDAMNSSNNNFKVTTDNIDRTQKTHEIPNKSDNNRPVVSVASSDNDNSDIIHLDNNWKKSLNTQNLEKNNSLKEDKRDFSRNSPININNHLDNEEDEIDPIVKQYMELVKKKKDEDRDTRNGNTTIQNELQTMKSASQVSGSSDELLSDMKESPNQSDSEAFW